MEMQFIQQSLPKPSFPGSSELDGLNLNISLPEVALRSPNDKKLPVFVFIHGGGYAIGGNWWPQYDTAPLVRLSVEQGNPIVAVNINYRTGCAGFLTTPELRKKGYKTNNGLRDQRTALTWIQKYITGFGGDAENVTVGGESAGGGESCRCLPHFRLLFCHPDIDQFPLAFCSSQRSRLQSVSYC